MSLQNNKKKDEKEKNEKKFASFLKGHKKKREMDFFSIKFVQMSRVGSRGWHPKCRPKIFL